MSILTTNFAVVETILKKTISRCPVCRKEKPAEVIKVIRDNREQVVMRRTCSCHGTSEYLLASDARFYWLAQGNSKNRESGCGCGPSCCSASSRGNDGTLGSNATDTERIGVIEKLSTCSALIELVDSCNMSCPTCFADSPLGFFKDKIKAHSFDELTKNIQGVIDRKGPIEILQFSGGEPTLHPDFFRLVEWVRTNLDIDYLLINTNGIHFAKDAEFVAKMTDLFRKYDNIQLYLQFDGVQPEAQLELRGADYRNIRLKAIENCAKINLPITLAMTVNEDNKGYLWQSVDWARRFENIRGISFQPMFISGRNAVPKGTATLPQPLTMADIIIGLYEQSDGVVSLDDFTPLPCGDPNCASIGWMMRVSGQLYSPSAFGIDVKALQATLPDRINYSIEDLKKCGCENTTLGDLMVKMEAKESSAFRFFIKPFMDVRTWDKDRIDRCCTHVIRPDGQLDSFCRYYFGPVEETCC